jgi:hypothetical protein
MPKSIDYGADRWNPPVIYPFFVDLREESSTWANRRSQLGPRLLGV